MLVNCTKNPVKRQKLGQYYTWGAGGPGGAGGGLVSGPVVWWIFENTGACIQIEQSLNVKFD